MASLSTVCMELVMVNKCTCLHIYGIGKDRQFVCRHNTHASLLIGERVEVSVGAGQTGAEVERGGEPQTPGATHQDGVTTE